MQLKAIAETVNAEVLAYEKGLEGTVKAAFGSDLMSDVLAYVQEDTLLITGLINQQVVRTAEMMDIKAILFVRGKVPAQDVIDLANEKEILLMTTKRALFTTSGLLYERGLRGVAI